MNSWWTSRTPRERALILAAFASLALAIVWLGYGRLSQHHANTELQVKRATQLLERATTLQPTSVAARPGTSALTPDELRRNILSAANTRGLAVAEVRMEPGQHIAVQLDEAAADVILAWLVELETKFDAKVHNAAMTEVGGGLVRSRFEFELAGTP